MAITTLHDLFHDTLRDIYYAEKKLVKTLPKMAKAASNDELSQAFKDHLAETENQVTRLEQVFEMIEKAPRAKKCPAMDGLVEEGGEVMKEAEAGDVRDAGIVAAAQAVEHYEIARYGTLVEWAKLLQLDDAASLLEETLNEEKAADELLSGISETVNSGANASAEEEHEEAAE